jgi:ribosomal protein S27AE
MPKSKMICPRCGSEMNHHADKLIYSTERNVTAKIDPSLGGLIEETHNCPGCGAIASRIAEPIQRRSYLQPETTIKSCRTSE